MFKVINFKNPDSVLDYQNLVVNCIGSELFVEDGGCWADRHQISLFMIIESLKILRARGVTNDFKIPLFSGDKPTDYKSSDFTFAYCASDMYPNVIAAPDFVFHSWPGSGIESYTNTCNILKERSSVKPIYKKAFWVGNIGTNPVRQEAFQKYKNSKTFDIRSAVWNNGKIDNYVSLPDHSPYSILLDLPANGYSGRLKILLHSGRPVIAFNNDLKEFFYDDLIASNVIFFVNNFEEMESCVNDLLKEPSLGSDFANRALEFAKLNLTYNKAIFKWVDLIQEHCVI